MSAAPHSQAANLSEPGLSLDAYFARIAHTGSRAPTLETLCALQARHPAAVPFEAMDVLLHRSVNLDTAALTAKLVDGRRGGYCFEQNGLLLEVLRRLGFDVVPLLARVRWQLAVDAPPPAATHMVLRVTLDGVPWLVDVGFGASAPTAPLRLDVAAEQPTPHETFRLRPFAAGLLLEANLETHWTALYEILPEPRERADFEVANWFTSTHPSSHFRRNITVARSTADARYTLRDDRLTIRRPAHGEVEQRFLTAAQIEDALQSVFGLPVEPDWAPVIERVAAEARAARAAG